MKNLKGLPAFVVWTTVYLALLVAVYGYGLPFLMYNQAKISEHEIVIGGVDGFGSRLTYAVDRLTGDEKLIRSSFVPFLKDEYVSIKYKKSCACVATVFRSGEYYVSRMEDNRVYLSLTGDVFERTEIVPFERTKSKFDAGQQLLEEARRRFSGYLPAT